MILEIELSNGILGILKIPTKSLAYMIDNDTQEYVISIEQENEEYVSIPVSMIFDFSISETESE
jgi:hypothetical protein